MSGLIYQATNQINGKCYIGQSWNFEHRKYLHVYGRSGCRYFNFAMKKYGKEVFIWSILFDGIDDQSELDIAEDWAIWHHRSLAPYGYNLREGGNGSGKLCEEARERHRIITTARSVETHASKLWKDNHAKGIIERSKNISWRKNAAEAARIAALDKSWIEKNKEVGRRNSANQQWREKVAAGGSINAKPVICITTGQVYRGILYAARQTGVDAATIVRVCKKTQKTAGGFTWEYYNQKEAAQ